MRKIVRKMIGSIACVSLMFATAVQADFYVIPVNKKIKNVVTVAKSGADFTDIQAAIDSISGEGPSNPYLIYIAPGFYYPNAPIRMKAYVSISGSGEDTTVITGSRGASGIDYAAGIIIGANNTRLNNLTLQNGCLNQSYGFGIVLDSISMAIEDVTSKVFGDCTYSYAIISNEDQGSLLSHVNGISNGAGVINAGLYLRDGNATVVDSTFIARNGTTSNRAVVNSNAILKMRRSTVDANNGNAYGIFSISSGTSYVSQSSILRSVSGETIKCAACDDGAGNEVGVTCNNEVNGGL